MQEICGAVHPTEDLACGLNPHQGEGHVTDVEGGTVAWTGQRPAPVVTINDRSDDAREGNLGEVIDARVSVYGEIIPAFTRQAEAISAVLDHKVQPWEVPLIMIAIKLVRTTEAPDYSDNSDDIEGYLDIFRKLQGEDMIHARSVKEYIEERMRRAHS